MNAMLQQHGAKHIYQVPEGLRELCTDISREVLRSQPRKIYDFISEYVDSLLITRENTKVAVKLINNILLGSQAILSILYRTGLSLEQIAVAAPRIQKAFRDYLEAVDVQAMHQDTCCDDKSKESISNIIEATGATREDAERAAIIIQAAFRGHYERMSFNESQGKIQWQRAVMNTIDILKKAGATQAEVTKATKLVQYAYQGYYTRRNQKMDIPDTGEEKEEKDGHIVEHTETIQAVAWMEMMYEDSGLSMERANEAATVIQQAYKKYRERKASYKVMRVESTKSMVVEAILDNLREMVFEMVLSRDNIPEEYGSREDMMDAALKFQRSFKDHLRHTRLSMEEEHEYVDEFESQEHFEVEEEKEQPEVRMEKVQPEISEEKEEPEVTEEKAEPEVKEEKGEPEVKEAKEEPEMKEEKQEPEMKAEKEEPEVKEEKQGPEVKEEKEEPELKEEKAEPEAKEEKEEPEVAENKEEPEVADVSKTQEAELEPKSSPENIEEAANLEVKDDPVEKHDKYAHEEHEEHVN